MTTIQYRPHFIKTTRFDTGDSQSTFDAANLIDVQDVNQEAELLKLEGITPHRGLIKKRLIHASGMLSYFHDLPDTATAIQISPEPLSELDYNLLVQYLYSLPIPADIVSEFLDNPDDEATLDILLTELYAVSSLTPKHWKESKPKYKSLKIILLETIQERGKMSLEELFQFGSSIHVSKRPTQAVRISLRRLIQSKDIEEKNGIYYAI